MGDESLSCLSKMGWTWLGKHLDRGLGNEREMKHDITRGKRIKEHENNNKKSAYVAKKEMGDSTSSK